MSDTTLNLDPSALAALGEGHVAYVRAMRSEEAFTRTKIMSR